MRQAGPRIWLIVGDKLGDNAQVNVLAEELGLPSERKELRFKAQWVHGKPPFKASLHHLDLPRCDRLEPPWPDLIITIGRRPAMAALWVKRQSGGKTKIVLIGRPKRFFDEFDLVIATGQYRVPERANVLKLDLPLMRADAQAVAKATSEWGERLATLPRPLTAVLVGGATKPFRFGPVEARRLLQQVRQATGDAGSLYVSTSRRTSLQAADALAEALPANARFFRWTPEASADENPYLALLGTADRFVVTGDSISMMVEVVRMGKPLAIAPLPKDQHPFSGLSEVVAARLRAFMQFQPVERILAQVAPSLGLTRDFTSLHETLRAHYAVSFLQEGFPSHAHSFRDNANDVAARIRGLL
ncbi:mitochondrial fission ELM1 family protein [Aquibaculum arenosum]|uniref:ELM1/GtrOC1 family putative glycosyltransferase n=1 Tax=Aquibaculum arenosum TaxID=3032591 RepID=A0ABT5YHE4_9PROT|nr:ELM1/GtrOC1 family putative glycosyltransferase [Fodinicurvata sp. CAU 1616]MDF2094365.1 ELM1/GtrOC1 family putative glycosyltransferase [Fodinicurvata sp. CAU 1616]